MSRQGKGARKTLEERSRMRAGTSPWLSPNFNSVDVVRMMVEGEKKGEKEAHRQTETDGRWYLLPTNHGRTRGSCGGSVGKLSLMANLLPRMSFVIV